MVLVLIVVAIVSYKTIYAKESFADVIIILELLLLTHTWVYQESKAEKAIEALRV